MNNINDNNNNNMKNEAATAVTMMSTDVGDFSLMATNRNCTATADGSQTGECTQASLSVAGAEDDTPTSSDILEEIYWYIVEDHHVNTDDLQIRHVIDSLAEEGIWFWRDMRFAESQNVALKKAGCARKKFSGRIAPEDQDKAANLPMDWPTFVEFITPCASRFLKAFSEELVIPDWGTFTTDMTFHFYAVEDVKEGANADYIPILKEANSEHWALSICSTDGQRFSIGDHLEPFSIQSVSKPVTYALCLKNDGPDFTEQWIGCEPAGRPFNTQDLMPDNRPFNASVNTGAIMAAGLYASSFPEETWSQVVDRIRETWYELSGQDIPIKFSKRTYQSEKETAYNNFAIAYNLKARRGLPRKVDLLKMLDVYLGCCSIEMCVEALAVAAATFANGGVCPITGKEVFPSHIVRHVLSETMTCGMYDQSGHFAVEVGLPAKSGVSGVLMVIVPNVAGFATFSPRLNDKGNSVRGLAFCKRLVKSYRVHMFEPLLGADGSNTGAKVDPRANGWKAEQTRVSRIAWALSVGDTYAIQLRDIYLFSLVQAAASSREGLSPRMERLIRENYQLVYQQPVEDKLFDEVVESIKTPSNLKILEDLTRDARIPDAMRSIILMALVDIATIDDDVDETEKNVIVRIAVLLGIDRTVALMEINRGEQKAGNRFKDCEHLDAEQALNTSRRGRRFNLGSIREQILDLSEEILDRSDMAVSKRKARMGLQKASSDMEAKYGVGSHGTEETIALRREVFRLKRKVDKLTRMLHEARRRPDTIARQSSASINNLAFMSGEDVVDDCEEKKK